MFTDIHAGRIKAFMHRIGARVRGLFPLGISSRLAISFVAVTVLAATANWLARESVSVILWRRQPALQTPTHAPPRLSSTPALVTIDKKRAESLTSAIDRYDLASRLRVESKSIASDTEYSAAQQNLRRRASDFLAAGSGNVAFGHALAHYIDLGQQLVDAADLRSSARFRHVKLVEAINARLQSSLDGAWKIFGRVFARQSLLQLRAGLDAVRQHSDRLLRGEVIDAAELKAIVAGEGAVQATLHNNEVALRSAEGAEWVSAIEADFDTLVSLRSSLASLNSRYNDALHRFSQNRASVLAAATSATSVETPATAIAPRASHEAPSTPPAPSEMPVLATNDELIAETMIKQFDAHSKELMAAVTSIVLLLVIAISILTVRSVVRPVRRLLRGAEQLAAGNANIRLATGGIRELDTLAHAFNDMASRVAAAQETSRNQEQRLEETVLERTHKLQKLALQDPLTSLPNRRHLSDLLSDAIDRAARENRCLGVYFLDIDNFKNFNDSLGHVFGDRVLMSVANRLEEIADGLGFVARLGGDEFTFIYEIADSENAIHETGLGIVRAFQQLLSVDDRNLSVGVSVGASIFPVHGRDADTLLRAADSALFRAKELGRSQLVVFTPELIESAAARFATEQGLRRALALGEFELVYQPEVDLATMSVDVVEALIRWRMPDGRLVRPAEFLLVAEQSGLIVEISNWVLRTAVQAAAVWHHGSWPGARVAINISSRQLLDPRFANHLAELLQEFALPAKAIELELTETVIQTGSVTIAALRLLQSQGFGIALDDFGTGYSSLTSLEQLPLSRIKLDRSLIASVDSSPRAAAIARAIIELCEGLGLAVTAEGIERPAQLAWFSRRRSIFLQGYLLSEPVHFDDILRRRAAIIPKLHHLLLSLGIGESARPPVDIQSPVISGVKLIGKIPRAIKP
jgi:diguanylate cyclase (GGDEF)-like protein